MKRLTVFSVWISILFGLLLPSVYAAEITLNSRCGLADAILAANSDRAQGGCRAGNGADTITLSRDITLDGGLPKISSQITIKGGGYTISGDNRYRIFFNEGGTLTIHNLAMIKGKAENEDGLITNSDGMIKASTANPIGGAIVNWGGSLVIRDSSFSGNSAEYGGAIINWGELVINDSSFSDNSAERGGVIYNWGELSISESSFSGNSADWGGAIYNGGELVIRDSSFSGNSAVVSGGAIRNLEDGELVISESSFSDNSADEGGAILNRGELVISESSFSDNSADWDGGAIANLENGELVISESSFSGNSAGDENDPESVSWGGGAIRNWGELSISESSFSDNSAERGGVIYNWEDGVLSISESSFSGNSAERGGVIYNWEDGVLSISESSFSGNSAEGGGAIFNWGELSISDSTFSGNSADWGGAINNGEDGELSISNSTFNGNSAFAVAGAIYNWGELSIINSIIAGGSGDACYSEGRLKRNINNFIEDGSCSPAFQGDPGLGELVVPADGSPAYYPLLVWSRAIDTGNNAYCSETDQIGTARPQGIACDIGAYEYAAP